MIVGIHQPNFFPWIGYFQKIYFSDIFVFLDDVQIQKTGSSYTNRVAFNFEGAAHYVTAPLSRNNGLENINQAVFSGELWKIKFIKSLQANYGKCPFFKEYADIVFEMINYNVSNVADFNTRNIIQLSHILGLEANFVKSSTLKKTSTEPTQRLIDIVKEINGDCYLSGSGGANYQDENAFRSQGIRLLYSSKPSFQYQQLRANEFIPGLSILDALFNIGVNGIRRYFQSEEVG